MTSTKVEIYTDGSCIHQSSKSSQENVGAWVAILFIDQEKIILKDNVLNTTHNRMELLAIINGIEFAKNRNFTAITIYTDSNYAFQLKDRKNKLKANKFLTKAGISIQNADLVQILIHHIESLPLEFIKVKAHQSTNSINYNREADKLARKLVREFRSI